MADTSATKKRSIALVVHKYPLKQQPRESEYWRTQPHLARLAAVEEIRHVMLPKNSR